MPEPEPEALAETAVEIDELDVDEPQVAILMGSKSDLPAMEKAETELTERGIRSETRVMSAHREPDIVADYAKNARLRGIKVIIAGAGLSAALPGVVAAHTDLPGHRGAADQPHVGGRWPRRAAVDLADAAGRAGGVRGRRQRAQRRRAGGAHPVHLAVRGVVPAVAPAAGPPAGRRTVGAGRLGRLAQVLDVLRDHGRVAAARARDPAGLLDRGSWALCSHLASSQSSSLYDARRTIAVVR